MEHPWTLSKRPYLAAFGFETESEAREVGQDLIRRLLEGEFNPGLEEFIAWSRIDYPNLFSTRASVLDHVFCTIGNGYEWCDGGMLVPGFEPTSEPVFFEPLGEFREFYPLSPLSNLLRIPDNVRDDWLRGCLETLDLILERDPSSKNVGIARETYDDTMQRFAARIKDIT